MNKWEIFLLNNAGKVIQLLGFIGFVLTIFFDKLRGRLLEIGHFHIVGIVAFILVIFFGVAVSKLLETVREYIEKT